MTVTKELFVANLDWNATEQDLTTLFSQYGDVEMVRIPVDKYSGKKRGFGFVQMTSPDQSQMAIDALNGYELNGRPIVVKFAEPKTDRPPRSGGGGNRYGGGGNRYGGGGGGRGYDNY